MRRFQYFDLSLFIALSLLVLINIIVNYSATYNFPPIFFKKQLIAILIGILVGYICYYLELNFLYNYAPIIYILSLIPFILVIFIGKSSFGAERWLGLGKLTFQPSEFVKITSVVALASYISDRKFIIRKIKHLIVPGIIFLFPTILALKQPDVGTAGIFFVTGVAMLCIKGIPFVYYILLSPLIPFIFGVIIGIIYGIKMLIIVISVYITIMAIIFAKIKLSIYGYLFILFLNIFVGFSYPLIKTKLKPYQIARIEGFFNQEKKKKESGWQTLQAKIAIGSGGIFGKGYLNGTQKSARFLPAAHTDFIFAVIGEEFGIVGAMFVLFFLFFILNKAAKIASYCSREFNKFLAIGIGIVLGVQIFENIGMNLGILPVVGIPLPFISYGGTSTICSIILGALLLNVAKHKYDY